MALRVSGGGEKDAGHALEKQRPRGFEALHLHHPGSSAVLADVTYPKSTTAVNTATTGYVMLQETNGFLATAPSTAALRAELGWLRARYDAGAVAPSIYVIVKKLEEEIAWREHSPRTEGGA